MDLQRAHRLDLVRTAMSPLLGPIADAIELVELEPWAWRTTVRLGVADGRAGYRARRSHDIVAVDGCPIAHPLIDQLIADGRYGAARELVIRVGARTGDRMVRVDPVAEGIEVPEGVRVIGVDELAAGRRSWIFEEVAGRRWRISADSFFQARPDGAEAMVAAIRSDVERLAGRPVHLVDLYAGVGLFAGTVPADRVTAVESNRSACADARVNLDDVGAKVVSCDVDRWSPTRADVVVADPSRRGLGRAGVRVVDLTRAPVVVLVSCDLAAAVRDVSGLLASGFRVDRIRLVDLFPHTDHVEVLTTLSR